MENTITLYRLNTYKKKLNKTGLIGTILNNIPFKFKNNYDLFNPVILFEYISMSNSVRQMVEANYVKLRIFDGNEYEMIKYYFIIKKTFITKELVQLELHEDTLFTFMNAIMNMNLFVERSTNYGNRYISDPLQTISDEIEIDTLDLGVTTPDSGYYNIVSYTPTRYILNTLSSTDGSGISTNASKNLYNETVGSYTNPSYVIDVASYSDIAPIIKEVRTNAGFASSLISFYGLPITTEAADAVLDKVSWYNIDYNVITSSISALHNAIFDSAYTNAHFDTHDTGSEGKLNLSFTGPLLHLKIMEFNVPNYSNWVEIEKYKYILQLPFIGQKEIDIRDYADSTISIYLDITVRSGDVILICQNFSQDGRILFTEDISAMFKVDTSTTNALENKNQLMMMGTNALTKYASNVASLASPKQTPIGFGADVFTTLWGVSQQEKTLIPKATLTGVSALGSYIFSKHPILFRIKTIYDPLDANEFGRPCNRMETVSNLSGYAKFGGTFNNVIITGSDDEREDLISLLKDGIII